MRLALRLDPIHALRSVDALRDVSLLSAAVAADLAGADGLVLRLTSEELAGELPALRQAVDSHLILELAPGTPMLRRALEIKPDQVTLVPSGPIGGDESLSPGDNGSLKKDVASLHAAGMDVSVLILPQIDLLREMRRAEVDFVTFNTNSFARARNSQAALEQLEQIESAALAATRLGLRVSVSHGLDARNLSSLAQLGVVEEAIVGHSLYRRALFIGLDRAFGELRDAARWYSLRQS